MTQGFTNEWQPGDTKDIDGKQYDLESWQRTHAQLLKSVADAQAKLLAAQNEICDQLSLQRKLLANFGERLDLYVAFPEAFQQLKNRLSGQLDAIGAILAELLTVRRPVARPAKRRRKR